MEFYLDEMFGTYCQKGDLEGLPIDIIERMVMYQHFQTGRADTSVFEKGRCAYSSRGGVDWCRTPEGANFWYNVLVEEDFSLYFKKYPRRG